jgi:hypothetical protein
MSRYYPVMVKMEKREPFLSVAATHAHREEIRRSASPR